MSSLILRILNSNILIFWSEIILKDQLVGDAEIKEIQNLSLDQFFIEKE